MASNILDTIMSMQPKEGGGGAGETRETVVFRMAEDMLDKLPQDYVPHEVLATACYNHVMISFCYHFLSDLIMIYPGSCTVCQYLISCL